MTIRDEIREQFVRQPRPVGGHPVSTVDRADGDGVLIGAGIAHHADALHRQQHGEALPKARVPPFALHFLSDDGIRSPQQIQPFRRDLAENTHRETGPGKRLADDELVFERQLASDLAHLVLEELPQRLDQLHPHALGQAADVVVALDQRRLPHDGHRFDDVGVQRALRQKIDLAEFCRLLLEDVDERRADNLPLLLRIDDPSQAIEETRRRIDEHKRQVEPFEPLANLIGFVEPQNAVVDENARQLLTDRAMDEQSRDRRVYAAAQPENDPSVSNLRPDFLRRLLHERCHRPVAGAAADAIRKVSKDLQAVLGVHDLRMKQERVECAIRICHRRDRRVGTRRQH